MSEQAAPSPLYVVITTYGVHRVAMRGNRGEYAAAIQMQGDFDNLTAALKVCEALTVLDVELARKKKPKPRGVRYKPGVTP